MRRARKTINQINVVPYIDVMLVLLVIFMVTAPLINPGEIELPSVGSRLTAPAQPLEVTLRTDGTLLLAGPSRPGVGFRAEALVLTAPGPACCVSCTAMELEDLAKARVRLIAPSYLFS